MTPDDRRAVVSVAVYIIGVVALTFAAYAAFRGLLALGVMLFA